MPHPLADLEYLETLDEAAQAELRAGIKEREDFIRMEPTTRVLGQLVIGDLFKIVPALTKEFKKRLS